MLLLPPPKDCALLGCSLSASVPVHMCRVNVDAAWAGCFALLPEVRERYFQGLEGVDSFIMNPHKGLLVNYGW